MRLSSTSTLFLSLSTLTLSLPASARVVPHLRRHASSIDRAAYLDNDLITAFLRGRNITDASLNSDAGGRCFYQSTLPEIFNGIFEDAPHSAWCYYPEFAIPACTRDSLCNFDCTVGYELAGGNCTALASNIPVGANPTFNNSVSSLHVAPAQDSSDGSECPSVTGSVDEGSGLPLAGLAASGRSGYNRVGDVDGANNANTVSRFPNREDALRRLLALLGLDGSYAGTNGTSTNNLGDIGSGDPNDDLSTFLHRLLGLSRNGNANTNANTDDGDATGVGAAVSVPRLADNDNDNDNDDGSASGTGVGAAVSVPLLADDDDNDDDNGSAIGTGVGAAVNIPLLANDEDDDNNDNATG
ncbi:hypothetical protein EW145_g6013, partial [Phellinidium pouzarii]